MALILLLAGFGVEIAVGNRDIWFGALLTVLVFIAMFIVAVHQTVIGRALKRLEAMQTKTVDFVLTEQSFSAKSELGSGDVPWAQFEKVSRYPNFWILYFGGGAMVILPIAEADKNAHAFILKKLQQIGAIIC